MPPVPIFAVTSQPPLWYRANKQATACQIKVFRRRMALPELLARRYKKCGSGSQSLPSVKKCRSWHRGQGRVDTGSVMAVGPTLTANCWNPSKHAQRSAQPVVESQSRKLLKRVLADVIPSQATSKDSSIATLTMISKLQQFQFSR